MVGAENISTAEAIVTVLLWGGVAVMVYLLPVLIARSRNAPNVGSIAVIDVFLGWTFIGWVVALAMAFRDPRPLVERRGEDPQVAQELPAGHVGRPAEPPRRPDDPVV